MKTVFQEEVQVLMANTTEVELMIPIDVKDLWNLEEVENLVQVREEQIVAKIAMMLLLEGIWGLDKAVVTFWLVASMDENPVLMMKMQDVKVVKTANQVKMMMAFVEKAQMMMDFKGVKALKTVEQEVLEILVIMTLLEEPLD